MKPGRRLEVAQLAGTLKPRHRVETMSQRRSQVEEFLLVPSRR